MNCSTMSDKSRVCLTLAERRIVILESEKGVSARKLANMFKCGKTQINNIIKNKGDILREWESNKHSGVKRKRKSKYGQVNDFVYEWFKCARAKNLPVSGPMLQEIARQHSKYLNLDDFTGSNGWLESFRKKHNISFRTIGGEGADVSVHTVDEWKTRLSYILATCDPKDFYSVDETGIFYKKIPSKFCPSNIEECNGEKMIEDRITVLFCCNSAGDKEPPLVIGKSQKPRCFKNVDLDLLEVKWYANKKAWMTSAIFEEWLEEFNSKMLKQNRNVILLLDKAPCHSEIQLSNVNLMFLPSETSHLQPLNQGILQTFKFHYRKSVLRSLLAQTNDAECMSELIKKVNVGDAVSWIKSSWNAVKDDTIQQCFRKHENHCSEPTSQIDPEGQIEELQHLAKALGTFYDVAADLEDIPCFDNLDGDWEGRLQEYCRGAMTPEETESDEESDRLRNLVEGIETVYVPEIKQEEISLFDDFCGDGESLLQEDGRGEMISEETESDKESDRLQYLAESAKTEYITEIKQEEVSSHDGFGGDSESPLQEDYRRATVCEEMAFDQNDCQTLLSLKEGITVLRKIQPLCRVLDNQYGENTTSGLNKLLESFETCLVKESCKLPKQTT